MVLSGAVLYSSRGRNAGLLLTALVFVAGGVGMILDGQAFGWFAVFFFGMGAVVALFHVVSPGRLEIPWT